MKNLLAIFLMAILFVSCEGPQGPPGENAEPTYWVIENDIEVKSSDWQLSKMKPENQSIHTILGSKTKIITFI